MLNSFPPLPLLTLETIPTQRAALDTISTPETTVALDPQITLSTQSIPGPGGEIPLSILRSKTSASTPRPAILYLHGGGLLLGNALFGIGQTFPWISALDAVLISVDYRLAPEHVFPGAIEDCYAALLYIAANAEKLGIDPEKIFVAGHSAGGGLAVALTLMARDRKGPKLCGLCAIYPMLDDRMQSVSSQQYMREGTWSGLNNIQAWDMYLPGIRGSKDVSPYAAPARAEDVSGFPPTWIDVGGAELFRDEDLAFARRLMEVGTSVEVHVWPGSWHGSDGIVPAAKVSVSTNRTRVAWFVRVAEQLEAGKVVTKL